MSTITKTPSKYLNDIITQALSAGLNVEVDSKNEPYGEFIHVKISRHHNNENNLLALMQNFETLYVSAIRSVNGGKFRHSARHSHLGAGTKDVQLSMVKYVVAVMAR